MALSTQTRELLMHVSTATLCTALFKRGLHHQFIQNVQPLNPKLPNMVGEAYTLRYIPAREEKWLKSPYPLTTRVSGKRLGIVGLGRIGQVIARRASGFDMDIRYHNRKPNAALPYVYEPSLAALASWCDFLVVASAGGAETKHLISRDILKALGPRGFLINISRGSVIDELALIEALEQNQIAGAGLDVYDDEPNIPERLLALNNAVLLPHLASATHETRQAMADLVTDNLRTFFSTGQVKVAVPS